MATRKKQAAVTLDRVRTHSRPSDLKITDMRTATLGWDDWHFTVIRIDTNQDLCGYGESAISRARPMHSCSRAASSAKIPVMSIRFSARSSSSAIMAGKAERVRCGNGTDGSCRQGLRRPRLRVGRWQVPRSHPDLLRHPDEPTGRAMGKKLKQRMERGLFHAQDGSRSSFARDRKGGALRPAGLLPTNEGTALERMFNSQQVMHPFTHSGSRPRGLTSHVSISRRCARSSATRYPLPPTTLDTSALTTAYD